MRTVAAFALATVVVATAGCNSGSSNSGTASSTPTASNEEAAALMQVSRDWAKAAESRDVERVVSYWADDAIVLEVDQPALVGKAAIRGMVQGAFQNPQFSITAPAPIPNASQVRSR